MDPAVLGVVAAGGALGASTRYALALAVPWGGSGVPWATLTANVLGCLLIGVLMGVLVRHGPPGPEPAVHRLVRPFLGVGVLGGFTTFSTTLLESARLAGGGGPWEAAGYLLGTTVAALLAVHVGVRGAQRAGRGR